MVADPNAIELECTGVTPETANVRTFTFKPVIPGTLPAYLAGQFITLLLEIDGAPVRRCYTVSSAPLDDTAQEQLAITVKVKDGGLASNWLHQHLVPGTRIHALPPAGRFHIADTRPEKYAFFAGGVGITPVLSMARWLVASGCALDIAFIQCAREASEWLFIDELRGYAHHPGFTLHLRSSSEHGRLTVAGLATQVPDLHERQVLCCGPDGFMRHVQALAHALGVPHAHYQQESFEVGTHPFGEVDEAAQREHYTLTFTADGTQAHCRGDQTLLDAAREAGVYVPYSCEAGICGTCKVRILHGQVTGQDDGGLEDGELEQGWALACCYRPVTDLDIEL
ncbi:hybrid-cluster NAD(P)-dependent oxidoreductase [Pseudomonas sp. P115]|uniref:hybrid-cluster NAD(P)-dependent oxidoreductase n=1 Tax=Pseudomonas pisciculturae TaxID=2730413 RepID=UPI00189205C5|nr:hybrid-cluster NAD(P)-dependent oxidoreductase [Pseudomonas pisciculturae]MBF6029811.1 hybrid-cluster NAD(P)-dependent oxidoreductase [Pseudomonas pisciculturae]